MRSTSISNDVFDPVDRFVQRFQCTIAEYLRTELHFLGIAGIVQKFIESPLQRLLRNVVELKRNSVARLIGFVHVQMLFDRFIGNFKISVQYRFRIENNKAEIKSKDQNSAHQNSADRNSADQKSAHQKLSRSKTLMGRQRNLVLTFDVTPPEIISLISFDVRSFDPGSF